MFQHSVIYYDPALVARERILVPTPSRFTQPGRRWSLGRLTLTEGHLTLTSWTYRGREEQEIPLHQIERVAWLADTTAGANFMIQVATGEVLQLRLQGAALWKIALDELLRR